LRANIWGRNKSTKVEIYYFLQQKGGKVTSPSSTKVEIYYFLQLWVWITEKEFKQKPREILEGVIKLLTWDVEEKPKIPQEEWFLPSTYDILAKRYWKTPIEIMQSFTYSQLEWIFAWIEYNINIEIGKKWKNAKFYAKVDVSKYEDAMERVRKMKEKLGK
jgi:hypothetical protein